MAEPQVSVIINCWNGENFLEEAIQSVLAQNFRDWELLVWDNASTDRTPEIVSRFGDRIRYYRNDRHLPLYHSRNLALNQARGDQVAFLDHDDLWDPDYLDSLYRLLVEDPDVALAYANAYYIDAGREKRGLFSDNHRMYRGWVFDRLAEESFMPAPSAVLFRKQPILDCGGFNTSLAYCGDWDIYLKIALRGKFEYLDAPLVRFRIHQSNLSRTRDLEMVNETLELLLAWEKNNQTPGSSLKGFARRKTVLLLKKSLILFREMKLLQSGKIFWETFLKITEHPGFLWNLLMQKLFPSRI